MWLAPAPATAQSEAAWRAAQAFNTGLDPLALDAVGSASSAGEALARYQAASTATYQDPERRAADLYGLGYQGHTSGMFDWFTDLFTWFEDKKNEITGPEYSDAGIPHDAFTWSKYGMNVQQIDSMSVHDFELCLQYAGPWLRINMHTDEVAESNWYRLEPGLARLGAAAANTGIAPNLVVNLSGYSSFSSGDDYLLGSLSWQDKSNRYQNLAAKLTSKVHSLGWGGAIFEAWNEPDNAAPVGIGVKHDTAEFKDGLISLLNGFSNGVHSAGGYTAFSPFMTLNDTKLDVVKNVWRATQGGFDYFSAHQYDDDPGKVKYWAGKTKELTGDRPVIITEHGYQSSPKDADKYRRMAWALTQGFGEGTLKGVMGYVYASNHQPWVIGADEDFFWKVTHDGRP
ncbi:MAG: hypothetical protein V1797_01035 [Pseudomonadota bacterium]